MNQPRRVFGVSLEQAATIPPSDFGPLCCLAAAIRNVPGVFDAEVVLAKDQSSTEILLIRVHKQFRVTWTELTPKIQDAINRCCDPATRTFSEPTDNDEVWGDLLAA